MHPQNNHRNKGHVRFEYWIKFKAAFFLSSVDKVDELNEEIQRQRDLKATYKAHLERTQNYLRYCLDVAEEHGFLHHICNSQQCSPSTPNSHPIDKEPSDPHLAAVIDQAKLNGWYIEPEEVIHRHLLPHSKHLIFKDSSCMPA